MLTNLINAMRAPPCAECKGSGKVVIVGRQATIRTGKPDTVEMRCPLCAGTGKQTIRVK